MGGIIHELAEFLITPLFRWISILLTIILSILLYLNQPQRFSYKTHIGNISYKWQLYILAIFGAITTTFTIIGLWIQIPFTDNLPNYWYIYIFILYIAIITQITTDSKQYEDDGSFNPPPTYMLPQKYRIIISYLSTVVDAIIMIQLYIYFGISDINKKTIYSIYFLERFGGWYPGNKLDFLFDWSGVIDTIIKVYILYLQTSFNACEYGLPLSWNA
jgi:hypothetical protein